MWFKKSLEDVVEGPVKIITQENDLLKLKMNSGKYVTFHYLANGDINIVLPSDTKDSVMSSASIFFEDLFSAKCISTDSRCVRISGVRNIAKTN